MPVKPMPEAGGLYIHIPFCRTKCLYCGFYSVTALDGAPPFLEALLREADLYRNRFPPFDTLYLGGGTPSALPAGDLTRLLDGLRRVFPMTADAEVTVEVNPGDADRSYLATLRRAGVNRLNLGVQSFDDEVLAFLGRRHTGQEAAAAIEGALRAGFENIGLDLIYGLPFQSLDAWIETLRQAAAGPCTHLSCYQLTLEAGTPLMACHEAGAFTLPGEDAQYDLFMATASFLEEARFVQYEVSNFARPPRASRHNQKYWRHVPYLGLGPGAHSYLAGRRWGNITSLERYMADLREGLCPLAFSEDLTVEQRALEAFFLGMRTRRGIHLQAYESLYGSALLQGKGAVLADLEREGLVEMAGGWLRPTRRGLALADRLALI